jgi:hypothetical protein
VSITVQNIVDAVSQDVRKLLGNTGNDANILLDYTDRVHQQLLRVSRWTFLLSAPQQFMTQKGESDYWLGTAGSAPTSVFDTALNLTDIGNIKFDSVFDRSNFRPLKRTDESPLLSKFAFRDGQSRAGRPLLWRNSPDTPNVINLYPAPDNQNTYQPVPEPPDLKTVGGGAKAARTYYVRATYVDSAGLESAASDEAQFYVPANSLLVVQKPNVPVGAQPGITYGQFNIYISTTSNTEQQVATLQSADWTEPTSALTFGAAYPTVNNITPLGGYIIEFRYYKARTTLAALSTVLQIPDQYKDIVVSGVQYHAFKYLKQVQDAQASKAEYQAGIQQIIHDMNLFPQGPQFIRPDSASISSGFPTSLEVSDPSTIFNN